MNEATLVAHATAVSDKVFAYLGECVRVQPCGKDKGNEMRESKRKYEQEEI